MALTVLLCVAVLELAYILATRVLLRRERRLRERWSEVAIKAVADLQQTEVLLTAVADEFEREHLERNMAAILSAYQRSDQ